MRAFAFGFRRQGPGIPRGLALLNPASSKVCQRQQDSVWIHLWRPGHRFQFLEEGQTLDTGECPATLDGLHYLPA